MKNVALITGASSGIGREFSRVHASKGRDLVLVARRSNKLEELKEELETKYGINVYVIIKDLAVKSSPLEIFEELKTQEIEVDYLINNAGFGGLGYFHARSYKVDQEMIMVNILALTNLTKLFLPGFIKRGSGKILNVASVVSLTPGPMQAVYFASKAYVKSLSNALWQETRGTGVTVTAVLPGLIKTEFEEVSGLNKTNLYDKTFAPEKVASAGYKAMEKGKREIMTGVNFWQRMMFSTLPLVPGMIKLPITFNQQQPRLEQSENPRDKNR